MLSCLVLWQGRADSLSLTMERQQFERKLREQKAQVQKSPHTVPSVPSTISKRAALFPFEVGQLITGRSIKTLFSSPDPI